MKKTQTKSLTEPFSFTRPIDKLDIGFTVRGLKFHWVHTRKAESSPDRPWVPLRDKHLPPEMLKRLLEARPGFFGADGLARNGDLVLHYATLEAIEPYRLEREEENADQLRRINQAPDGGTGMTVKAEQDDDFDMGAAAFKNL
jgi:hypothetical protein